jgi:2-polyprenyl-3-methyl-5-hydroxy-6-metoxy-1,4-benzoquinol methylase
MSPNPPGQRVTDRDRELFNRIASRYGAKDLHRASRPARRLRLEQTLEAVSPAADVDILEIGCGAGHAASYLAGRYRTFTGIDHAHELIAHARELNAGPGVEFETADLAGYHPARRFDVILMIGVVHHFENPEAMMAHAVNLLGPGGWLVANEPQPGNFLIHIARQVRKRVDRVYSADQTELSLDQIRDLYRRAGLTDLRILPQGLLTTPFAEVTLGPTLLTAPLSHGACLLDRVVPRLGRWMTRLSWNLIAAGRRPS